MLFGQYKIEINYTYSRDANNLVQCFVVTLKFVDDFIHMNRVCCVGDEGDSDGGGSEFYDLKVWG